MACFNRRETTVRCLTALHRAAASIGSDVHVYLLNDGSTDGTADAVRASELEVTVLQGDGGFFWAKSMAAAETAAVTDSAEADVLLWLNDDVTLDEDALRRLLATHRERPDAIVVGAVRDPDSGDTTYTGLDRSGWHPLSFTPVSPSPTDLVAADTFNGNVVLIPVSAQRSIGPIDGAFSHALADIDYGLRAGQSGVDIFVAPGTVGTCARNPALPRLPLLQDWERFRGAKGGSNKASTTRFLTRHAPHRRRLAQSLSTVQWWRRALQSRIRRVLGLRDPE